MLKTNYRDLRSREDSHNRFRHASETSRLEPPRIATEGSLDDQVAERDRIKKRAEHPDGLDNFNKTGEEDLREGKTKANDRINLECDESGQDDPTRRRANCGSVRSKGKGRVNEGVMEKEHVLNSLIFRMRFGGQGRNIKDRNSLRSLESKRMPNV
ncbi:hypothetical protein Tco_1072930 [Tanacetum coccineum]